jgi:hypothetical protein
MIKELVNRVPGVTTAEHPVAKLQRTAYKPGGSVMAAAALVPEPWLAEHLCEQHVTGRIDLATGKVMVVKKPAEIMDVVPSLQHATGNVQELAGKITGMPVTGSTTVVPQPVHVYTGRPGRRCHQHRHKQQGACNQVNSQSACASL